MVSIITCTVRGKNLDNVLKNYAQQKTDDKELIVVLNEDQMSVKLWEEKAEQHSNVRIFQLPSQKTLGECLNFAVQQAKYEIIAKFDDDDYYSPYYIPQALKAFEEEQADVVGKRIIYTYLKPKQLLGLRQTQQVIGGGTISFRKKVAKTVPFPLKNRGEDTQFLAGSRRNHFKIHVTDPYNYVCVRDYPKYHTWKQPLNALQNQMYDVTETDYFVPLVTKE